MTRNSHVQFGGGPIEKEHLATSLAAYPTKPVILANAAAIIVAHNHPSGEPTPSYEDIELTKRLKAAAELLGIRLLDHIIVGENGRFYSFLEDGALS